MSANMVGLPAGWKAYGSDEGIYYYNEHTDETSWNSPLSQHYEKLFRKCVEADAKKGNHAVSLASRLAKHHEDASRRNRPVSSHGGPQEKTRKKSSL